MAKGKKNEILEEQKKARREFLDLKKMQHGEMEAPPKPSEVAVLPKTRKEKWENFWFHYKWHVIAATAIVVILAVLITQCATRKKYDMEVVLFSYHIIMEEHSQKMAEYLSKYAEDVNGDGVVRVQVINCSFEEEGGSLQYARTMMTKLQAIVAGDENAILFLTDEGAAKYLNEISEDGFLEGEPLLFGEDFYEKVTDGAPEYLPEGLRLYRRRVTDTVIEKKKGTAAQYKAAQKLLKSLEKAHQ